MDHRPRHLSARARGVIRGGWGLAALALVALTAAGAQELSLHPSHQEMMSFLLSTCTSSPFLEMGIAGHSIEGRAIPYAVARDPGSVPREELRLLVMAGLHGDEPAGTTALLHLLASLSRPRSGRLQALLRGSAWMFLPMLNPDGAQTNNRRNRAGVDLAREWSGRAQPESRALHAMLESFRPHLVLDLHEHAERGPRIEVVADPAGEDALAAYPRALRSFIEQRLRGERYTLAGERGPAFSESGWPAFVQARYRTPALLVESRRNGIPLNLRAGVHVVSVLAAAEYLVRVEPPPGVWPAPARPAEVEALAAAPVRQPAPDPAAPAPPLTSPAPAPRPGSPTPAEEKPWRLEVLDPPEHAVVEGVFEVRVAVDSPVPIGSILLQVDGRLRAVGNVTPFRCRLDASDWQAGFHQLLVVVRDRAGRTLGQAARSVRVPGAPG